MSGSRRQPGPLGPFVDGYSAWLVGRGYSPSVVVRSLSQTISLRAESAPSTTDYVTRPRADNPVTPCVCTRDDISREFP